MVTEIEVERGERSKLLSLSTELLLLILDNVRIPCLLVLSRTSRLLHELALPAYLSRHGINDPASRNLVLESHAVQALPGFQISLFIASLDTLSYKFRGVHPHFAQEVNQLLRFVTRLTQVNKVTLDLGNIDSRWVDGLAIASSNFWKPDFIRLLTVILHKRCVSLTVVHGRFLYPGLSSPLSSKRHTVLGGSTSVVTKFLSSSLRSAPSHAMTIQPTSRSNELHKFCIHADLLLSQPFYDWTILTLNTSRIASVSFRLSALHSTTWATILSSITIPTLTHFAPETADIMFADLLKFFSRHPSIIDVSLHPHITYFDSGRPSRLVHKKRLLPNLTSVSGSPGNIKNLLRHLRPVLQLQSIFISLPIHQRLFQTSDFERLNNEIGVIVQVTKPLGLSLKFSVPFFFDEPSENRARPQESGNFLPSFHSVQTLKFSTDGRFDFTRWIVPVLLNWISKTFPALHHVSFADDCVPVEPESRAAFIHTVSELYHEIEIVIREQDEVDVSMIV